ncbi:putative short chain dehydrogenase [Diaporthe ampelina]|uniref:Putative short chain dehydrogenase n=1 Tax=Diaporthe ampelina TaxID=1214573 RepID=A0A0G2FBP8_9PEZI|nr:putative short chain dehydrogenase [Diaporthe ampelina]
MADQVEVLIKKTLEQGAGLKTNFTKTVHRTSYPSIDPARPELSQAGRTVLITGGGTGIGLAIGKAFGQAGAKRVIAVGRRASVLADGAKAIEEAAKQAGKDVEVIHQTLDVTDKAGVAALWSGLKDKGIIVDVLVLNAAKFSPMQPLVDLGSDEVWSMFEANVHGPLMLSEAFVKQGGDSPKALINVASQAIHMLDESVSVLAPRVPAYGLTKNSGALLVQQLAAQYDPEKLQVVNFHPGVVYAGGWEEAGIPDNLLPFDDASLAGSEAVWLASPEARFLHGRFVWASWDVDELKSDGFKKALAEDVEFLKIGVHGLKGGDRRW